MKHEFNTIFPPTIIETPSGRWAVSGKTWISVGPNVTLEEVRTWWNKPIFKSKPKHDYPNKVWNVVNSKKDAMYMVSHEDGKWNCACTGFGFRGKCKHIEQIKSEYNESIKRNLVSA